MKVGFFLLHPFWDSMASGVRTLELARSLMKIGVEPIVFSPYEQTRLTRDGVRIVKVPTLFSTLKIEDTAYCVSRRVYYNTALQKLVIKLSKRLSSGQIQLSSKLDKFLKPFDLDILQAEQDNAALALLPIRSSLNIPIVLDLHGIWPEELLAANSIKQGSKEWVDLQGLMKRVINDVDLTICLSDAMKEYVLENYDTSVNKAVVVPPGGRVLFNSYPKTSEPWKVVYAGIVSYRKHVDLFVRSFPHVKSNKPNANFFITKKGDLLTHIQNLASKLQIDPTYFWFSNFEETLKFLASCHVGVLPSTTDTSARISMPSKLFDYLSIGLPVVANDVGGWTNIIKDNHLGRVTKDSPKAFASGILELLDDPDEMANCAIRGIELIKNKYNWDASASLLMQQYEKLA